MISRINMTQRPYNQSFRGNIIDAHTHLGKWEQNTFTLDTLDTFVKIPLENGDVVEKMLVSSADCLGETNVLDEITGNKKLLGMIAGNKNYAALAVCQPNLTQGDTSKIKSLLDENPKQFVGLKFHPREMKLPADSLLYDKYLELAQEYHLPCLFHSDQSFDINYPDGYVSKKNLYSRPEQIYTLAKRHKDVPVILGHMGGNFGDNTQAAVDLMVKSVNNGDATLYADISWVNCDTTEKPDIITAIKKLMTTEKGDMTERLLFGTDAPLGRFFGSGENGVPPRKAYSKTVEDIKKAIRNAFGDKADGIIEKIFYKNADNLFFKKAEQTAEQISQNTGKTAFSKYTKFIAGGVVLAAAAAVGLVLYHNKKPAAQNVSSVKN